MLAVLLTAMVMATGCARKQTQDDRFIADWSGAYRSVSDDGTQVAYTVLFDDGNGYTWYAETDPVTGDTVVADVMGLLTWEYDLGEHGIRVWYDGEEDEGYSLIEVTGDGEITHMGLPMYKVSKIPISYARIMEMKKSIVY